ncbi:MAG: ABC transporter substrate-binding protein [Proteobacteria bacterium]|nr:ABC transporter substrate-binding protein [Pseudomonadota bacterium]
MKITRRTALLAASSAAIARPALAEKSTDTLRIQFVDAVPNVDMYFNSQRTGLILAHQAWDMLVHRDPSSFDIKPSLATDWKFVDASTLDLTIRQGVKFHDGSAMGPDDVVYTLNMAADPASKVATPSNYNWIAKAEKTGDWTVRIHMKRPTPAALEYLAMVTPIHPKAYREKVGPEGFAKAPIGAGPYRIAKNVQGQEIVFERFADYWAGSPKGKPAIKTLHVRFVPDLATEVTNLLAKQVDWIWNINPDQMKQINQMPHLQAVQQESMRIGYLSIDAAGRTGKDNPLTKLKVRQAMAHAINRKDLIEAESGFGTPIGSHFPPHNKAYIDLTGTYPFDIAKGKALLAEAGYPNGFDASLKLPPVGYAQRAGEVLASQLGKIGIKVAITQLQWPQWLSEVFKEHNYDLTVVAHTEANDLDRYARDGYYWNYNSPAFKAKWREVVEATDFTKRDELLKECQRIIARDAVNGFLYQLAKIGVWKKELVGMWENSPTPSVDLTGVHWKA